MAGIDNRYTTIDLFLPESLHDRVSTLVMQSGGGKPAPFERQIDLWWLGVLIGCAIGKRRTTTDNLTKFNVGAILSSDPSRLVHLELIALAEEGPEVLEKPRRVIQIASEFANTGLEWISDKTLGEPEPILALASAINDFRENTC